MNDTSHLPLRRRSIDTAVFFDTSAYNRLLRDSQRDRLIVAIKSRFGHVLATHIQRDEIARTTDSHLGRRLMTLYDEITTERPTADSVASESRFDECLYSDGVDLTIALNGIATRNDVQVVSVNRLRDAMICRTASQTDAILIHNDKTHMVKIAKRLQQPQMLWEEFRAQLL